MLKKIDPVALAREPRVRKWAVRLGIFAVVLGLAGFLALPPLLKWVLVDQLGKALQREVTVESVSFNPYTLTVAIQGLSVREAGQDGAGSSAEVAGFDSLRLNAELGSVFVAGVVIKEIELLAPRLRLTRHADRRYNFSDLIDHWMAQPPAEDSKPPRFSVSNIQISGGRLDFDDRLEGVQHTVTDLTLRIPFVSSLSFHAETYVEPHFSATINGAPLLLAGKSRPFGESHESELSFDLDDLQLAHYWAYSPIELPVRIDSGALDGTLRLRFVQGPAQAPQLTVDGSLALKDFQLKETGGAPLLSVKRIDLGIREADLIKLAVGIERIAIDTPEIDLNIDRKGRLNWLALLPPASAPGANATGKAVQPVPDKAAEPEKAGSPVKLTVDALEVKGGALRLVDQSNGHEQRLTLDELQLRAAAYDSSGVTPLNFSLGARMDGGDHARIAEIALRDAQLDLGKRTVRIGEYAMRGMRVKLGRSKDGNLLFLQPPQLKAVTTVPETPPARVSRKADATPPWQVTLERLNLNDHEFRFEDRTHAPLAVQTLVLDSLVAENISSSPGAEATLSARLRVNKRGTIGIDGKLRPLSPEGVLQLDLRQIELLPLQPYFSELLNLTVTRGLVTAKGEVQFAPGKAGSSSPSLAYKGNFTLGDFHSVDKANAATFLRWKSFHFDDIDVATQPLNISVGQIALSDFFARMIVGADGQLNLLHLVKAQENKPAGDADAGHAQPVTKEAAASGQEAPAARGGGSGKPGDTDVVPVKIGKVTLQGGRVNFTDNFVKPNYSANLTRLGGRISGLSSRAGTTADLELRGSYNDLAPLTIDARINPFAVQSYLDLNAEVKGIEMSGFTPYSGKYAGYAIEKGKLSLFLKYKIEDNRLLADNRIFLDQLTFGETVASPDATTLPVTLAVSLLKNRAGEIDINLPISGSLDDPEFSIGGVVLKVIVNLFVKAVTSPFALLGSLFGGGEEMAYVEFDYGYATIAAPMMQRMQALAKALEDRPALKIELAGRIDPEHDREGLKQALMERRVKAQRLEELVKQGVEAGPVDEIEIQARDYPRYLEKAYKAEKFPKPRNVVGLVKGLPVEEMEKLMLANMKADDEALQRLADRRARNVAQWLTTEGKVASERVFILKPHMNPAEGPQQEKAKASRVDFSLK